MDGNKYYKDIVIVKCQPKRRAGSVDAPRLNNRDFVGHPIVGLQSSNRCNSNSISALNTVGNTADRKTAFTVCNKENYAVSPPIDKIKKINDKKLNKDINQNYISKNNNLPNLNNISKNKILVDKKNQNNFCSDPKKILKTSNTKKISTLPPTKSIPQSPQIQKVSNSSITNIREIPQGPISRERKLSLPYQRGNRASQSPVRFLPFPYRAGSQPPFGNGVIGCGSESFKEKLNKFNNASSEVLTTRRKSISQQYNSVNRNFNKGEDIYHNSLNYRKFSIPTSLTVTSGGFQSEGRVAEEEHLPQYVSNLRSPSHDRITFRQRSSSRDRIATNQKSPSCDPITTNTQPSKEHNGYPQTTPSKERDQSRSISFLPSSSLYNRRKVSTSIRSQNEDNFKVDKQSVRPSRSSGTVVTESPSFERNISKISSICANSNVNIGNHKDSPRNAVNKNFVKSNDCANRNLHVNSLPKLQLNPINSNIETSNISSPNSVLQNSKIRPYSRFLVTVKDFNILNRNSPQIEVNLSTDSNNKIISPVQNTKIRPFIKSPIAEEFKPFPQSPTTSSEHTSVNSLSSGDILVSDFSPSLNITAKIGNKNSLSSSLREKKKEYEVPSNMEAKSGKVSVQDLVKVIKTVKPNVKPLPGYELEKIPRYVVGVCMDECYPGLYIGDLGAAMNKDYLKRVGITHVLNTAEGSHLATVDTNSEFYSDIGIKYLGLQLHDVPTANIAQFFVRGANFIDECLSNGGKVLVHCFMGISRSSTISASYLMQKKDMSAMDALTTLRQNRSIYPNEGFLRQLIQLEEKLKPGQS